MLAGEDFITYLNDQRVALVIEALAGKVGIRSGFLQGSERRDHLTRDQILPYAEMLQRALCLRSPQLVARHIDLTDAVSFLPNTLFVQ